MAHPPEGPNNGYFCSVLRFFERPDLWTQRPRLSVAVLSGSFVMRTIIDEDIGVSGLVAVSAIFARRVGLISVSLFRKIIRSFSVVFGRIFSRRKLLPPAKPRFLSDL